MKIPPRSAVVAATAGLAILLAMPGAPVVSAAVQTPPRLERLSDTEFWTLVDGLSEKGGSFHSDNFTSNEPNFAGVARKLATDGPHGGAYLGVGPEQNFHYIAAIRPAVAFVFDIRRQAVVQHLLYKALFELSDSREEFIARLFSVEVPDRVDRNAPPGAVFAKFTFAPGKDRTRLAANLTDVKRHLTRTHGFALSDDDLSVLEFVYEAFFRFGPAIDYSGGVKGLTTANTNFEKLASTVDETGIPRSFLASDDHFQFLRSLQLRNLVVPVQADFGGPKSIRAAGEFLRLHGLTVSAFYISNVEQYLFNPRTATAPGGQETNGGWRAFYDNLAALPATNSTLLLRVPISANSNVVVRRTMPDGTVRTEPRSVAQFCPLAEFLAAVRAGKVTTQSQATACGR